MAGRLEFIVNYNKTHPTELLPNEIIEAFQTITTGLALFGQPILSPLFLMN